MEYRVTKYQPNLSSEVRQSRADAWTSVTDIGQDFGNEVLTLDEYLKVENLYISAIEQVMRIAGCDRFRVEELEDGGDVAHLPEELKVETAEDLKQFQAHNQIAGILIRKCIKLILREVIWCKLVAADGFFIHFGYDYYMYFGGVDLEGWIPPAGLYCERYSSPYNAP